MTTDSKTTHNHTIAASAKTPVLVLSGHDHPLRIFASKTGRFILHLLEMFLSMEVGMIIFHLLVNLIPESSPYIAAFERGTNLYTLAMTVSMIVPMIAWMIVRGHGWRHCAEMALAMLLPMAAVALLCQLGVDTYLPWLAGASGPAMWLGMIVAMLYRRDHYT